MTLAKLIDSSNRLNPTPVSPQILTRIESLSSLKNTILYPISHLL